MTETRTETDSFGPLEVPADKYWGAQTQRSIINFPIGWEKQPVAIVRALGVIKKACAMQNKAQGTLDTKLADAIIEAAGEAWRRDTASPALAPPWRRAGTPVRRVARPVRQPSREASPRGVGRR